MNALRTLAVIMAVVCAGFVQPSQAQTSGAPAQPQFSDADFDKLLAPIALYPDALIVQIAQCSVSPYQVKQVNDWLTQNPDLKGTAAQDAASKQGFDASFVAIVLFPQVLQMMAEKPDWTRDLGQAFNTNKDGFFASVQRLRKEAQNAGNLKTTEQQTVQSVTADGGQQVIVIQPANPQVVYVPQYNPQVVYTQPAQSTTYVQDDSGATAAAAGVIGFAAGVIVGAAADNDDDHYYYNYGGWGYARPICYPGGYNNYYQHRENMANDYYDHRENMTNDYYDHRENMADQRGQNVDSRTDARTSGQETRSDTRTSRQDTRSDTRTTTSDNRSSNVSSRQDTRSQGQSARTDNRGQRQDSYQQRGGATNRSAYQRGGQVNRGGGQSGAFSGYQRGSTERASASRGRSSMGGRSAGASRGGGGRRR